MQQNTQAVLPVVELMHSIWWALKKRIHGTMSSFGVCCDVMPSRVTLAIRCRCRWPSFSVVVRTVLAISIIMSYRQFVQMILLYYTFAFNLRFWIYHFEHIIELRWILFDGVPTNWDCSHANGATTSHDKIAYAWIPAALGRLQFYAAACVWGNWLQPLASPRPQLVPPCLLYVLTTPYCSSLESLWGRHSGNIHSIPFE